ncbi:MAG: TetR/AcrR family transcriptional regulator [Candidatus Aminicenantes bacterium]|nr:TetR/AcrR family transcriptional regulator [Candidatus Aminicenantes bacterium]
MSKPDKRAIREKERRRANREAILHAAEAVIRRKGLSATSMDDVAVEAGFSKPTVYRYVRTKAALVCELMIHYLEDVARALEDILARGVPPREKLLDLVRYLFRYQFEKAGLTRYFILDRSFHKILHVFVAPAAKKGSAEERKFLHRIKSLRREVMAKGTALFEEGIASGDFRPTDVRQAVLFLSSVVQGYVHEQFWNENKPNLENDVKTMCAFILHGIERPQPQQGATA